MVKQREESYCSGNLKNEELNNQAVCDSAGLQEPLKPGIPIVPGRAPSACPFDALSLKPGFFPLCHNFIH